MKVLGIDIGGTNIRMGIVNEQHELTHFERRPTQELLGNAQAVENLIAAIRDYLERTAEEPVAVAIGIPGQVARDKSYVYTVPYVQAIQHTDLGNRVSAGIGLPVYVGHATDYLLTHDIHTMGLDPDHDRTILGFYLGTGLGNALYIDGRTHSGKHGVAGELGHIPLYEVTDTCGCGAVGCAETRCCGNYLAKLVEREFPGCYIGDIFVEHGDDPRIVKFVKDYAYPLASEITILDPDYVIIGGGIPMMKGFPREMLEEEVRSRCCHPLPAGDVHFIYATDAQSNGVVGGAMAVMDLLKQGR